MTASLALLFTRYYCFTSRLYCTIIFLANTPFIVQYIAQHYQLLHPPPNFEVFFFLNLKAPKHTRCLYFEGVFEVFV